jgi:predicted outer membrane repeat protein
MTMKSLARPLPVTCALIAVVALALLAFATPNAHAANTLVVAPTGTNTGNCRSAQAPCKTITYALGQATAGDTIRVTQGTYAEPTLAIDKTVTLLGDGDGATILSGAGNKRIATVANAQTVTFQGLTLQQGSATQGGAIMSHGTLIIVDSQLINNSSSLTGGAIWSDGTVTISRSTLSGNTASGTGAKGGAIYINAGTLTISSSTISNNKTTTAGQQGGALYVDGTASLNGVTATGNSGLGTGVFLYLNSGSGTISNSTITGNLIKSGGGVSGANGGVLAVGSTPTLTINNSTIVENTVEAGSGLSGGIRISSGGKVFLKNTILALNGGGDCSGSVKLDTSGFNLIGSVTGCTFTKLGSDKINVTAGQLNLDPLGDNGGHTLTRRPGAGSLAIDGGGGCTPGDQRGAARPLDLPNVANAAGGDGCDIGAYEQGTTTWFVSTTGSDGDGTYCSASSTNANPSPCKTIAEVLIRSLSGDTVMIAAGSYPANITLSRNMTFIGAGAAATTLSGGAAGTVVALNSGVVSMSNMTIGGGSGPAGGVWNKGTLTLTGVTVNANSATGNGGGIRNDGALTLSNVTLSGNTSDGDGGGIANGAGGTLSISTLTVSGNTAAGRGGGIFNAQGAFALSGVAVNANGAGTSGGGIFTTGALTLNNVDVLNNTAGADGGGVAAASVTVSNASSVGGNKATKGNGGGVYSADTVAASASSITGNTADAAGDPAKGNGGGIFAAGAVSLSNSTTLSGNTAKGGDGGGVYATGGTVSNVAVSRNTAPQGSGGGIFNAGADMTLDGTTLVGGPADADGNTAANGGGVFNTGAALTLNGIAVRNNTATTNGGGVASAGGLSLTNASISGNAAGASGGGVYASGGTLSISGGTIGGATNAEGNQAASGGGVASAVAITLDGTTLNGNRATSGNGGGIATAGGSVTDATLSRNSATQASGGGIANTGTLTLNGTTLIGGNTNAEGNTAANGGGLYNTGSLTLNGQAIRNNQASINGGGVFSSGALTVNASMAIAGNQADSGGGIYNLGGTLTLNGVTVGGGAAGANSATNGGGIYNTGSLTSTGGALSGNTATAGKGGGIYTSGTSIFNGGTIDGNTAANGGGLYNAGGLTLTADTSGNTASPATISGNTATGSGGGIYSEKDTLGLNGGTKVTGNTAANGGGIFTNGGTLLDSAISGNTAGANGGGVYNGQGILKLTEITLGPNNTATSSGGGIYNAGGSTTVNGGSIAGNTATSGSGGGVANGGGGMVLNGAGVDNNAAATSGGGIFSTGGSVALTASSSVTNNRGGSGGGIALAGGTLGVTNSSISGNTATSGNGGGISSAGGGLTLSGATVGSGTGSGAGGNQAANGSGGGIFSSGGAIDITAASLIGGNTSRSGGGIALTGGTLGLGDGSQVSGNAATAGDGGGILSSGGILAIDLATIGGATGATGNTASGNGGGIALANGPAGSVSTIGRSTLSHNSAGSSGGAIQNAAGLEITGSTFDANGAPSGAAIAGAGAGAKLTLANDTLAANLGPGSAIANGGGATLTANNVTIAVNGGTGLANASGSVTLSNSLLAGNAGGAADCSGTIGTRAVNLIQNTAGCALAPQSGSRLISGADARLGPLQANGGPTMTIAPLLRAPGRPDSPAINAGDPATCALADQRGESRSDPLFAPCDVGAYEQGLQPINRWFVDQSGSNSGNTCKSAESPCQTLGEVINNRANDLDIIVVQAGEYPPEQTLTIAHDLTIQGVDKDHTILTGAQNGPVIQVSAGVTLRILGMTIRHADGVAGDGIVNSGTLTLDTSLVSANSGAGLRNSGSAGLIDSAVDGNSGAEAGIVNTGQLMLQTSSVGGNTGTAGGILTSNVATLTGSTVSGNTASGAGSAGGITNSGTSSQLTLTGSTVSGNTASGAGSAGGIMSAGASSQLTLTGSNVYDNTGTAGGGILAFGKTMLTNSSVGANTSTGNGGGIANVAQGKLTLIRSTVSDNQAAGTGGGVSSAGTLIVNTSTIANNTSKGTGGAVLVAAGSAQLTSSTVSGNRGQGAGGIQNNVGAATQIGNTIVSGNNGADCVGTVKSNGYNLLGGCPRTPAVATDKTGINNPALGPLQNNGGPNATMAPLPPNTQNSPAVNGGGGCSGADQRGRSRQQPIPGGACDIGAIELEPLGYVPETDPNGTVDTATPLYLDGAGHTSRAGTIADQSDFDVYAFTGEAGALVSITLDGMPENADYDIVLVADPSTTSSINDTADIGSITDIAKASRIFAKASRIFAKASRIFGPSFDANVIDASTQRGKEKEQVQAYLRQGGKFYLSVYGHTAPATGSKSYRLDMTLREGALVQPAVLATPIAGLKASVDPNVKTIYVYNSSRMGSAYPDPLLGELNTQLGKLTAIAGQKGVLLDLNAPGTPLLPADLNHLKNLYGAWDAEPGQPLLANEVARQIHNILDHAIARYYPNVTSLVVVGGDKIIPFYRTPDEMDFGPESDYRTELRGSLQANKALDGSLLYRFTQTDNFYADRLPTAWRGRELYLPDQAIGRLVESPGDIVHYLRGYLNSNSANPFTISVDASTANILVNGYEFLKDNASRIADKFDGKQVGYILDVRGTAAAIRKVDRSLIRDDWTTQDLLDTWFSKQWPRFRGTYQQVGTSYAITSLNGHFSHSQVFPAKGNVTLTAQELHDPTAANDVAAFFKLNGQPTLLYSVGCHSGLSAPDGEFGTPGLKVDFPSAMIKQGGNWIGNTGYGYGEDRVIAYSERLALRFTEAIGRNITNGSSPLDGTYIGAEIGESLVRAKWQYLQNNGVRSFSVADEKVIEQWTLYGLPFIRVKVSNPIKPDNGVSFDREPQNVPAEVKPGLKNAKGILTRTITFDNTFQRQSDGTVKVISNVSDSFSKNVTTRLESEPQTILGGPVMPLLSYDITLNKTGQAGGPEDGNPLPRGVRLVKATSLRDIRVDPVITSIITDTRAIDGNPVRRNSEAQLSAPVSWMPSLPYAFLRAPQLLVGTSATGENRQSDKLLVVPAQFNGSVNSSGKLRQFSRMVFEVTYIDPRSTTSGNWKDKAPPTFESFDYTAAGGKGRISAIVRDNTNGKLIATATYSPDGSNWTQVTLRLTRLPGSDNMYRAEADGLAAPVAGRDFAFFEVRDAAGHVTTEVSKRASIPPDYIYLPLAIK